MKQIAIIGSTGSIGRQALQVIDYLGEDYAVSALAAGGNTQLLAQQARRYAPQMIAVADAAKYNELKALLPDYRGRILCGLDGVCRLAAETEGKLLLAAASGMAGILPVVSAIDAGKDIALANKEVLVAAGDFITAHAAAKGVKLLPVDSEHCAVWQCLEQDKSAVEAIILTASGGPFLDWSKQKIAQVTPQEALRHPTWQMGRKISIDSASLMNKGLEVIEAHHLFDIDYDKIKVLVHPQSIVHSLVAYSDGAFLAQLGPHDMKIPIQYAFTWPKRTANALPRLQLAQIGTLDFRQPDGEKFPCLDLAYRAGRAGGVYPCVMNAANEVLVNAFLDGRIAFGRLPCLIEDTLAKTEQVAKPDLSDIMAADAWARDFCTKQFLS